MTLATPLPPRRPSAATTARPPAAHAAAERRRSLDLRRGQSDDDVVADLDAAVDDLGVAAVADAGAHLHRRELLGGLVEQVDRSEEHTSELQSHVNLVCRLLLEKKKK